jgi:PAS domain S-box-containing protein
VTTRPPLPQKVWDTVTDQTRLEVLRSLGALGGPPDPDFDRLVNLAGSLLNAPIALVTLLDTERQWFLAHAGTEQREAAVGTSFCAHAIDDREHEAFVVLDASQDARFAQNPLVTGPLGLRFYAGSPLSVRGQRVGTLCVFDSKPRTDISPLLQSQLSDLAGIASSLLELKDEARVRARTAAALMREEWRHALTLEAGKVGSWIWDLRTDEIEANDILRPMFGIATRDKFKVDAIFSAIREDDLPAVRQALDTAFTEGTEYVHEFRIAKTGRWLLGRGRVYQRDVNGKPLVMMGINLDITETKQGAEHTRQLLLELNHRVKNTLAMIQALARQTLRPGGDPEQAFAAFTGRLRTLTETHSLLSDGDWAGIGLLQLIAIQVQPLVAAGTGQLELQGPDVLLAPDQALGLGLVLNELASNATRYGALSVPGGKVSIEWSTDGRRLDLSWIERGGPQVVTVGRKGVGSVLIERSLDKLLTSTVSLTLGKDGAEARISLPLGS